MPEKPPFCAHKGLHTASNVSDNSSGPQEAGAKFLHVSNLWLSTQSQLMKVPGNLQMMPCRQKPLQQSASELQELLFGRHIVVVEVVLVEVLVEVVLLVVVVVVARHLSVEAQLPRQSQRWFLRWRSASSLLRQRVSALRRRHLPSSKGMWQMRIHSSSSSSPARAREGISAAKAVPAKSLSARRLLIEPSASALARSSKERLVVCLLTCCPLSPKGGTMGISPALS
jgi:hypothetical protein